MKLSFDVMPAVIGHRGACAYAPENTMASFTKAKQLNIPWVEFDVMPAACGEVIVFHDETLDRTTNGKGFVKDYPYAYLRTLDAGSWFDPRFAGERIPTLKQVLPFILENKMAANIEFKALPGQEEWFVERVLDDLEPYFSVTDSRILFSSFYFPALRQLRELSPHCHIGLLLHDWEPDWPVIAKSLECVSIHVNQEILTKEKAAFIKDQWNYLLCYTVNDASRAAQLYEWGVDAVFSDTPDSIAESV